MKNLPNLKHLLCFASLLIFSFSAISQGENNKWYFGFNAAVDFNTGSPVSFAGSAVSTSEGCASIADMGGNTLFYTDGVSVWNKNNIQMPNGFGLLGESSTTQSALIAKQPGNSNIYYIFTADQGGQAFPNAGIHYSIVDMNLLSGLGDVTTKNVNILTNATEKLTAVAHCNGIWIISHQFGNADFYVWPLTSSGLGVPSIQNVGTASSDPTGAYVSAGYLKASPDGKRLALAGYAEKFIEIFNFNISTGTISNPVTDNSGFIEPYGVAFSSNSNVLYVGDIITNDIVQYDLLAGSPALIVASKTLIGNAGTNPQSLGALQLAPDGKIYSSYAFNAFLGVINNPNTLGTGCNFVANGPSLTGGTCALGLPNNYSLTSSSSSNPVITAVYPPPCLGGNITLDAGSGYLSYSWSPGGATTQTIIVTAPGTYTVTVADICGTAFDTITVSSIGNAALSTTITATQSSCGQNDGSVTVNITGGTPGYTYSWTPSGQTTSTATGLSGGNYTVTITDNAGCTQTATVSVTQTNGPTVTSFSTPQTCTQGGTATANSSGGTSPYTYQWCNGQTTSAATGLSAGTCTVIVTDASGCTTLNTVSITTSGSIPVVNVNSIPASCNGGDGTATATASGGTLPYSYLWNNGQTTSTATGLSGGSYTITVTDASGCTQTQSVIVAQQPGPAAVVSASPVSIAPGNSTQITATGGVTYSWAPSSGLSCTTCTNPVATPTETTIYCVWVTDANNCTDTACITIYIEIPCGDIFVPNAFSPNSDGQNELECVLGNCIQTMHFAIYDRLGEKVFEAMDQKICWDGKYKGKFMNTATFVYYLQATLINGEQITKKGNISLIR